MFQPKKREMNGTPREKTPSNMPSAGKEILVGTKVRCNGKEGAVRKYRNILRDLNASLQNM